MDKKIFREKSIDRIDSPEAMKDYMQVATPGIWMMLIAIVILLMGAIVWSVLGRVETKVPAVIVMQQGSGTCYFDEASNHVVSAGMQVKINDEVYTISEVSSIPEQLSDTNQYIGGMLGEDDVSLVVATKLSADLPDGVYRGSIITEEITPIKFLTN